jgi:membrane protein required for beta-lactamase induction
MMLIALILGLTFEHVATQLLHLRELRWFDRYNDFGLSRAKKLDNWMGYFVIVMMLLVLAVPVLYISYRLQGTSIVWDLPYLVFAVFVIFLCLGPRDLGAEVDEYCTALDNGDEDAARRVLVELSESERPWVSDIEVVEEAILVQAPHRLFGVVFWFILLGPAGAWLFRISDLLRRRAAFESVRDPMLTQNALPAVERIYGVLNWLPSRLAALGYALSGSFDDALNAWRSYQRATGVPFERSNDQVVARVGRAAMTGFLDQPSNSSAAARNAMRLVTRTLFIWVTVIALMTIFGLAV